MRDSTAPNSWPYGPLAACVAALILCSIASCAAQLAQSFDGAPWARPRPAVEPPLVTPPPTRDDGLDDSELPARYPDASWLPIVGDEREANAIVPVALNGHATTAMLDTGATHSLIGERLAKRLEVLDAARYVGEVEVVAHGRTLFAQRYRADLRLGDFVADDTLITVFPDSESMLVVGFSVLSQLDVLFALDGGLVGLFPAGRGPTFDGVRSFELVEHADGVAYVDGWVLTPARDRYQEPVPLLIDTGATSTDIPERMLAGHRAVGESAGETVDGRLLRSTSFDVGELVIGRRHLVVGQTIPHASPTSYGHLGLDVLRRYHAVFSARRRVVFLEARPRRPEHRLVGPGGRSCSDDAGSAPCIEVALIEKEAIAQLCVTIRADFGRAPLALAVSAEDEQDRVAWGGGAATLYLRRARAGAQVCEPLKMSPSQQSSWAFSRLTLDRVFRPSSFPCGAHASCLSRLAPLP